MIEFNCEISASLSFFSILCLKLKNENIKVFFREYVVCSDNVETCSCFCKYHVKNRPEKAYFYKKPYSKDKYLKKKVKQGEEQQKS